MKYFTYVFLYLLSFVPSSGQDHLLFVEEFDNNKNNWIVEDIEEYKTSIKNGVYSISNTKGFNSFYHEEYLDPKKNYYFEGGFKLLKQGESAYGYGITWSVSNDRSYYFQISRVGSFIIYDYHDGKSTYYAEWTSSDVIQPIGKQNVLAIEKKGKKLNFYINSKLVHEEEFTPATGVWHGVSVPDTTNVEVSHFLIKHPPTSINVIPNVRKGYKKENLGSNVNTVTEELHPTVSYDGKALYVTRDDHPENTGKKNLQDIWVSELQDNNSWGPSKKMPPNINTDWHNSIVSVSPDNNTIFIDIDEGDEVGDRQGLFVSHRKGVGWSDPEEVQIDNYYNHNQYESYHISANRKVMVMSLERDDTQGGEDIYVSFLKPDDSWTEPKNLGENVNTYADDFTPFLAADNITLYYATYGFKNYGSADIYMTKRLDDTWTNWSEPQNLGDEINTPGWDAYFTISAHGDYAYLVSSSDDDNEGSSDVYRIKLAESAKPEPVVWLKGYVYDKDTKEPVAATIHYEVLGEKEVSGIARNDEKTGYYQIILPYGYDYDLRAEANGHVPISETINNQQNQGKSEISTDLYLEPIAIGQVFDLKNVLFERSKAVMLESSYQALDKLVLLMKKNPSLKIELGGHTDNQGSASALMKLSKERVTTVENYLIDQGIDKKRVVSIGYGSTRPNTKNRNEEQRKLNRRVEFKVLKY